MKFPDLPSGLYDIQLRDGRTVEVYCDMEGLNCGNEGGWTRLAYINMTNPMHSCPSGFHLISAFGLRFCDPQITGCGSTNFSSMGLRYQQVCGQLQGYQAGHPTAFSPYISSNFSLTIDDAYLDGISITYGSIPRKHIWSYTTGDEDTSNSSQGCPCNKNSTAQSPPFVGNDYYCESAATTCCLNTIFTDDPLWDGNQCSDIEAPCCTTNNRSWFSRTLTEFTTDDVELRSCGDAGRGTFFTLINIFVR